jgi:dipeptidyl aminopeptidase/acylaminoacyl peptidase
MSLLSARFLPFVFTAGAALIPTGAPREVTVHEGTSMSVAASRDGTRLAIDLQGSLWVLPVAGGTATRITDAYHDARQPSWSADGRLIAFQGYDEDGFDLWVVGSDGTGMRRVTWGPYDDREPTFSPDGRLIAFSSDRSGNTDIWVLDVGTGAVRQVTRDAGDDYMPTFSPSGDEIAFIGTREGTLGVYAIALASGTERRLATGPGRVDAPSWGPGGRLVHHATTASTSQLVADGAPLTGEENAFAFRAGWLAADEIVYVADGRIRRRRLGGGCRGAGDLHQAASRRGPPDTAPGAGRRGPGDLAGRSSGGLHRARGPLPDARRWHAAQRDAR